MNTTIDNLIELRRRLLYSLAHVLLLFLAMMPYARQLYAILAQPLLAQLPSTGQLIATSVVSPMLVPLKLCLFLAILTSIPFISYQAWQFITPGLYQQERRTLWMILGFSSILFYLGVLFCFSWMLPLGLHVMVQATPTGVVMMTDMNAYFSFVTQLCLAFGLCFEIPLVMLLAVQWGWLERSQLRHSRPYIVVAAFTMAMFLTPPDVISQLLLAIPMWMLFELGLLISWYLERQRSSSQGKQLR